MYPHAAKHKEHSRDGSSWAQMATTPLFQSKRAETLAYLLDVRRRLVASGFTTPTVGRLRKALATADGAVAVKNLLRRARASHVGIDMLDITVCGAIDPYRAILGGKLVSLLMASPEVAAFYELRYETASSVIASAIAGRALKRKPTLGLLCTTSLYAVGASQYNRLKMPAEAAGGREGTYLEYVPLGESRGWGSYHLSSQTTRELDLLLQQEANGRRVNSIFGEGVSPKLRKLRAGLDLAGLPPEVLLNHGSKRLIYVIPLVTNVRDVLLGRTARPRFIIPRGNVSRRNSQIIDYWKRRWLSGRIEREGVLEEVAKHNHTYPVSHGARVVLPTEGFESTQIDLLDAG
jgi:hypothetical protein